MSPDDSPQLYTRAFAIAFAAQFCFIMANMLLAHYARWVEFLGGNVQDVGWIMGAGAVAALILRPVNGSLIGRLGARKVWLLGLLVYTCGVLPNIWLHDLGPMIYLLRFLFLVGCGLVFTSGMTYITQTVPTERLVESIAVFGSSGFIAMALAPLLGDWILGVGGRSRDQFILLFLAVSMGIILNSLLLWFLPDSHRKTSPVKLGYVAFLQAARQYWPGPIVVVSFLFYMIMSIPFIFLPSYIDRLQLQGTAISAFGVFFLGYGGWGLVVRLGLRQLPDRAGRRKVLFAGLALTAMGMLCFLVVNMQSLSSLLLLGMLCGSGHAICVPTISALMLEPFPNESRGMGSTLTIMFSDMGMIVGAPVMGTIAAIFGYQYLFVTAGLITVTAMIYFGWMTIPGWYKKRNTKQNQPRWEPSLFPFEKKESRPAEAAIVENY